MLELLPDVIILQICLHLDVNDVTHLSTLSKKLYAISNATQIWENYFQKNYRLNYQLIKKLEGRNQTDTRRNWKLEFLKKFTERRCAECGFVYNCFNQTSHTHAPRPVKKIKSSIEKPILPPQIIASIPQQIVAATEIHIMDDDLILKDFASYVYRRKSKYLRNTERVTAKRSLFV